MSILLLATFCSGKVKSAVKNILKVEYFENCFTMSSDQFPNDGNSMEKGDNTAESNTNTSDINQNIINNEKTNQFRGLNNLKPSPDSGWTFPSLANSPMIPNGISPQSQHIFLSEKTNNGAAAISSNNNTANLHLPLKKTLDGGCINRSPFMDPYQTRISPLVDMNIHQQQMLQHRHFQQHLQQQIHIRNKQRYQNALTPNSFHPNINMLTPNGLYPNVGYTRTAMNHPSSNNKIKSITPNEDQNKKSLPSFSSLTSSVRMKRSPDMQNVAQMSQLVSLFQKEQMRLPLVNPNTAQYNGGEIIQQGKNLETERRLNDSNQNRSNSNSFENIKDTALYTVSQQSKLKRPTLLGKNITCCTFHQEYRLIIIS